MALIRKIVNGMMKCMLHTTVAVCQSQSCSHEVSEVHKSKVCKGLKEVIHVCDDALGTSGALNLNWWSCLDWRLHVPQRSLKICTLQF